MNYFLEFTYGDDQKICINTDHIENFYPSHDGKGSIVVMSTLRTASDPRVFEVNQSYDEIVEALNNRRIEFLYK
jgi:hypothetical protein